ncbi:MAG: single-stranded DNA-binding protein [Opitutales bacterium]|nr:single-stranded DNA-binding protein [Opitutales bacterium]
MKITIRGTGRLTAPPETKNTQSGGKICSFSVAVSVSKDEVQFHECRAFGNTAEFIQKYFTKGKPIEIAGWLGQSTWTDKDTQKEKRKTYLYVSEASFVLSEAKSQTKQEPSTEEDDNVPY